MGAFEDFLAEPAAARCWLLELEGFPLTPLVASDPSASFGDDFAFGELAFAEGPGITVGTGVATLYYSDRGFISAAADTPASTYYEARLGADVAVERRIYGREGVGGLTRTFAACTLLNNDGGLDTLQRSYAIDGRAARLLVGRPGDARSSFGLVFSGVVEHARTTLDGVQVKLSDGLARLEVPANSATFAGSGGLEGGADLAGKPKPLCYGSVYNVEPPLVDSAKLIYQVHDGALLDVPTVYDRGIALTKGADYASQADLESIAPAAGQYRVYKAGGYFRLGSTPAGTVTADASGDNTGGTHNTNTADIVEQILLDAGLDASEIDATTFAQLATDASATVGIWVNEVRQVRELVEELLLSVGAFGGFSRSGVFTVGRVAPATGTPAASFTQSDILELTREPLPPPVEPAVWRTRIAWQRNYTVQTDLAAAVTAARRTFAAEPERVAKQENAAVQSRHRLAREYGPHGNLYAAQADADAEATRLLSLWAPGRAMYRVQLPPPGLSLDLGNEITLTHPRLGLDAGAQGRVIAHSLRGVTVELMVLV